MEGRIMLTLEYGKQYGKQPHEYSQVRLSIQTCEKEIQGDIDMAKKLGDIMAKTLVASKGENQHEIQV